MISAYTAVVDLGFGGENRSNREETFPSATLSTTDTYGLTTGSNPFLRDKTKGWRHVKQPQEVTCKEEVRHLEFFHTAVFQLANVHRTYVRVTVTFCPDRVQ
jgi:hypothetical protein